MMSFFEEASHRQPLRPCPPNWFLLNLTRAWIKNGHECRRQFGAGLVTHAEGLLWLGSTRLEYFSTSGSYVLRVYLFGNPASCLSPRPALERGNGESRDKHHIGLKMASPPRFSTSESSSRTVQAGGCFALGGLSVGVLPPVGVPGVRPHRFRADGSVFWRQMGLKLRRGSWPFAAVAQFATDSFKVGVRRLDD